MREYEFSLQTKLELAAIAQYRCVRPGCNQPTHFYDRVQKKFVHIGSAAHDAPAGRKEAGLRANNDLTPEQKRAYENGAWLCRSCATLVDIAQHEYPLGTISGWQAAAEERYISAASAPVPASHIDFLVAVKRASEFLEFTSRVRFAGTKEFVLVPLETRAEIQKIAAECYYLFPLNGYSSLYPHTVNVQGRMVNALVAIRKETNDSSAWRIQDGSFQPHNTQYLHYMESLRIQTSCARVNEWINDYFTARDYLGKFVRGQLDHHLLYLW